MAKRKFNNLNAIMKSAAMSETTAEKISPAKSIDSNSIIDVEIKYIKDNPYQPRLEIRDDDLQDLSSSIKENGLLQPILLNKNSDNSYNVVAGHRRVAAHKLLKMKFIKSIIIDFMDINDENYRSKMSINALIENIQREDLDILEMAIAIQNILNEKIYHSKQDLAKAIGKSNVFLSKILSILKLDNEIINDLRINKSVSNLEVLYELQKITKKDVQKSYYYQILNGKVTREDIRDYNKRQKEKKIKESEKEIVNYKINSKIDKMIINVSTVKLDKVKQELLEKEITEIIKKYID